jgi:hypothetical protein
MDLENVLPRLVLSTIVSEAKPYIAPHVDLT